MGKREKIRLLAAVLVTALVLMGAGYAAWSKSLQISSTVATGELSWSFTGMGSQDTGNDWVCDPGFKKIRQVDKDVARTILALANPDASGRYKTLEVTVANAYPSYYNRIFVELTNDGTIPIKIKKPVIDKPREVSVELRDRDKIEEITVLPGESKNISFHFRVNGSAKENTTYKFTISFAATQWNAK
ncbi:hypothetical protein [Ammonifex thiophilus]|uniref:Uncharacterized protein n=1 Tax=Ammonifex thiophilus TaxID=444093 RepID=A0A3D8P4Q7_9THEO|nr:hypothetical protein [Ammonifex thiophilus]RDV82529.1 hypothetical protein DXX99_07190 [Ammonifex thiophilus]